MSASGTTSRRPGGTPSGGQFAAAAHQEGSVALSRSPRDTPLSTDELDVFCDRVLSSFHGDQAAYEAVQSLRSLARCYPLNSQG